ncbi:MAG: DUF4097 family beta strand repeat-containing protein [Pyrinomonadaceae bacterium]
MNKKTLTALIIAVALIHGMAFQMIAQARAPQQGRSAGAQQPEPAASGGGGSVSISNQSGRVQIKLERGSRVAISNRFGRITITGWDRDTVEATATSEKGAEAVQVEMTADPAAARSLLALTVPGRPGQRGAFAMAPFIYANPIIGINPRIYSRKTPAPAAPRPGGGEETPSPEQAAKPGSQSDPDSNIIIVPVPEVAVEPEVVIAAPPAPPRQPATGATKATGGGAGRGSGVGGVYLSGAGNRSEGINLDVKMPRYALLDAIEIRSGDLTISDLDGPISISSGSSNLNVSRVGALEVRARSGNINVEGVEGLVYIVATSGEITVKRAGGDVRATSINGDINIQCVKGRVDASNARGGIILSGVDGDVEASTTDADINFTGAIRQQGRYRLKSMEGRVVMSIPENSPGFTAILASYNNDVVTTFPVITEVLAGDSTGVNRRVVVKQGDGRAQITLDSFSKAVQLTKLAGGPATSCK